MPKINDITIESIRSSNDSYGSGLQSAARLGMWAPPRPGPLDSPERQIPVLLAGTDAAMRLSRLAALGQFAPLVELSGGTGLLLSEDEPGLAYLGSVRALRDSPSIAEGRIPLTPLGGLGRFRGRLDVTVRTIGNVWGEPGLTRVVLPEGSLDPSDPYADAATFMIEAPSVHGLSDNWGNQDAAYVPNEVARGYLTWDWAAGWWANQVQVVLDPAGDALRAESPGIASDATVVRVSHRKGHAEFRPATGKILLNDTGLERTVSVEGFTRWALVSWSPHHAEFHLGRRLYVEIHANGLVRFRRAGSRLSLDEAANDIAGPATFSSALDAADWWLASTIDYSVTAGAITISGDGEATIIQGQTSARMLAKDVRSRLGVMPV